MNLRLLQLVVLLNFIALSVQAQDILFPAKYGTRWGYIDTQGSWVIEPYFKEAREFTEGLAAVKSYDSWGFIDGQGNWIINAQFENATPFNEGLAAVVFNNRWGFVDHKGEFVIEPTYHKVSSFSEGLALVSNGEGYFYITHKNVRVGDENFINALPFAEGMAPIVVPEGKGYIDNNGYLTIKHEFQFAAPFSEGRAQVRQNNRWGFIDRGGNVIIPLEYSGSSQFSEGLAAAARKNKWGYIDADGSWVIDPEFESAQAFHLGYAVVKSKGEFGIIDHTASWTVEPSFSAIGIAGSTSSIKEELTNRIREVFGKWALKGEFEKTEDYNIRMLPENQKEAMLMISKSIIHDYGDSKIDFSKAELGYYNADLEEFNIFIPGTLPTRVNVPISEAMWFKQNWRNGTFQETDYMMAGENLILSSYTYDLYGDKFRYDINDGESYLYNYASIAWEEEITVPEISWNIGGQNEYIAIEPGTSDVDTDIPISKYLIKNTFALIIGNEDYKSFQTGLDNEVDVSYAAIDAEIFAKYATKTLGIPAENITLIKNGTAGQIKQALAKMNSISKAYDGQAEFIFYYAGHGLPDEVSGKPYLIPVDVTGSDLSFAISLDEALNTLTEHPHRRVTVFLDACFTGGGRNEGLIASRGVKIRPKSPFIKGNLVMFSASSANQSAFAYKEKAHGMFTYFLLKKLKETRGDVTFGELDAYLKDQVRKNAIVHNNKEQIPESMISPSFDKEWKDFQLTHPYRPEMAGTFIP